MNKENKKYKNIKEKESFAERLKFICEKKGMSQAELGRRIGKGRNSINDYLTGATLPSLDGFISIAKELNVSTDYLLGLTDYCASNVTDGMICQETGMSQSMLDGLRNNLNEINNLYNNSSSENDHDNTLMLILEKFLSYDYNYLADFINSLSILQQCNDANLVHSLPIFKDNPNAKYSISEFDKEYKRIENHISISIAKFLTDLKEDNFSLFSENEILEFEQASSDKRIYEIIENLSSKVAYSAFADLTDSTSGSPLYKELRKKYDENFTPSRVYFWSENEQIVRYIEND